MHKFSGKNVGLKIQEDPIGLDSNPRGFRHFPKRLNSVQIGTLQMVRHALLITKFNALQPHLET